MVMIFLLLFLNFVSNFVIFRARSALMEETTAHLRRAAVTISREVQARFPEPLNRMDIEKARNKNGLTSVTLLPVKPADQSQQARRDWFRAVTRRFPPSLHPDLADKLFRASIHELTRGNGAEYYYLYPIPAGAGGSLLVLTVDQPELAYLDDSRDTLMVVLIVAVGVVALVYAVLSRFMFRPFRRIKQQAEQAGRSVDGAEDETEAVVQEYENTINQLVRTKTELLRLNEEIRNRADSLELFNRYLMESSRSGVVTLDLYGRVVAINEIAVRLLDLGQDKLTDCHYSSLLAGREALIDDIGRAFQDESSGGYKEYVGLIESRPEAVLGVTSTEIQDRDQGQSGLLLMINDLTELAHLRNELENRNRLAALGEMAAGLAHQVRNSLGTISGYATLLKKRLMREDMSAESAESLLDETREANELIDRFLSFARPFEYTPRQIDLGHLVEECLDAFRVRQDPGAAEFKADCPSGLLLEADPVLLRQALGNLVDNAIKAYEVGSGPVEVVVERQDNQAVVSVRDYGCGIPSEEVDKIFTPFFSSRPAGTGLGLPLTTKIVDLHSGSLRVESEPGSGTRFSIALPLKQAEPAGVSRQEIPGPV